MSLVEVSGQPVEPVDIEEFRIGMAETYDVIVTLPEDNAYTLYAETMDRSGFAAATLAPREGMTAELPTRRKRPILGMVDMGMDHGGMDHGAMDHTAMGHGAPPAKAAGAADEHAGHAMPAIAPASASASAMRAAGIMEPETPRVPRNHGPENAMLPMSTKSRLAEPGTGLGNDGRRVLCYTDLKAPAPWPEFREPEREVELHLTGNMERFTWGLDGVPYDKAEPITLRHGERIRLTMVNDTMMNHPMHLHGLWMELENGHGNRSPRIHTINVKPAERVSLLVTADAVGRWAFHCHVLYHMEVGMFREFRVLPADAH
jgi:CopA family copper-resistance protein